MSKSITGLPVSHPDYKKAYYQLRKENFSNYRKDAWNRVGRNKRDRRNYWIGLYKELKGCKKCGYNKHRSALDFDHRQPGLKCFNVGQHLGTRSLKEIFNEIRKCDVLCANCHRIKTYRDKRKEINAKLNA